MSFEWEEYLTLARQLSLSADEASLRTAVSRAYYAAFHAARDYVESCIAPVSKRGGDTHKIVWDYLQSGKNSKPRAASRGNGLKLARHAADYEPVISEALDRKAEKAILDAEIIIKELES